MHFKEVDSINRNYRIYSVLQFVLAVAIFGTVCFIFSNSMRTGADSSGMSRAVQDFLQRLLRRLPDGQGSVELRLAQSQLHAAGGLGGKGGEPADAGKGEAGNGRIHGQTHG